MVRVALVALASLGGLGLAACSEDGPGDGEARLEVDGEAVVTRADGEHDVVTDRADIRSGDRVEVVEGSATMALAGGHRLELRAGHGDDAATVVLMGEVPELEAGDLLVATPERTRVRAAGTDVEVHAGAAKVSRSLGMGVASYDGEVLVDSAGQERTVPALRAVLVPSLGSPQPLRPAVCQDGAATITACPAYDPTDAWDRRYLGDAMELGERLESIADAYTSTLQPGEGRTPGFFRLVLPGLDDEADFTAELLDTTRAPGDTLVGAAIAELGDRGPFEDRWRSVFGFRDEGAEWGLVALDQAVSRTPLLGTVTDAISASPLAFAPTTTSTPPTTAPGGPEGGPPAGPTSPTVAPSGPTTTPPAPTTAPPSNPPPTTSPPTVPESPLTPILDPVVDPVVDLTGDLLDGLGDLLG
ncbi:MAG: hypothetical protein ACO1PW_04360 [Actinomycetota bacterium]